MAFRHDLLEILVENQHVDELALALHRRRHGVALLRQRQPTLDLRLGLRRDGASRQPRGLRRSSARQEVTDDFWRIGGNGDRIVCGARASGSPHPARRQHVHTRDPRCDPRLDPSEPLTLPVTLFLRRRNLLP